MNHYSAPWSLVQVTGPDAVKFVQNLCTNDVAKLPVGQACEAFFCDVKGRIQAHCIVCRIEEGCRLVVTSDRAGQLAEFIDRYHIREDLTIAVDDQQPLCLSFDPPEEAAGVYSVVGLGARLSFESPPDGPSLDAGAFHRRRIQRGFPLDRVDTDDRRLPQEVNRDALAISFHKGCYLGQETVARIDALGRVNWLLVPLRIQGDAAVQPGDTWEDAGKTIAEVTSTAYSAEQDITLLLAYVRREHAAEGTVVGSPAGPATVLATSDH